MTESQNARPLEFRRGDSHNPASKDLPLTVLARHKVRAGAEAKFEAWIDGVTKLQESFEGYKGSEVIRPIGDEDNQYVSIFRYDTYAHLEKWMDSAVRASWLEKATEFSEEPIQVSYHSLEFWFTSGGGSTPPSRHKMAVVTFFVIWSQVHFISKNVAKIPGLSALGVETLSTAIIVLLTTYVIMPIVTRVLRWWLFKPVTPQCRTRQSEKETV